MASLAACDYLIAIKPGKDNKLSCTEFTHKQLEGFLNQDTIEVLKKTKKIRTGYRYKRTYLLYVR